MGCATLDFNRMILAVAFNQQIYLALFLISVEIKFCVLARVQITFQNFRDDVTFKESAVHRPRRDRFHCIPHPVR